MQNYLLIIFLFISQLLNAQVMLPSFQAVQTKAISLPSILTTMTTSVTGTSAASGGNITNDGGTPVTSKGVCWDTNPNPTIALSTKTDDGAGLGNFSSSVTGLTSETVYYLRAYAVNSFGTAYGTQLTFIALAIGDSFQGGKLAYILTSEDPGYDVNVPHGLIAHTSDFNARWGTENLTVPGADGTAIGTGYQNTLDIIAGDALGVAAGNCRSLTTNGYSDWYMPSKDELNKLYINRVLIGGFNPSGWYFSSTESNSIYAWFQDFSNGNQAGTGAHKDWALSVRAIRSF